MSDFNIDKNVAPPTEPVGPRRKYPFASMEAGDSFFVPCEAGEKPKVLNNIASGARHYRTRRNLAQHHACRQVEGGVRCWRVA